MKHNAEIPDDGRRCHACASPQRPLVKYAVTLRTDAALRAGFGQPPLGRVRLLDMHPTCVGAWLMGNEGQQHVLAFAPGELGKDGQHLQAPAERRPLPHSDGMAGLWLESRD